MDPNNVDFLNRLSERINVIAEEVEINPLCQLKGRHFNNTNYVIEAIQGAIMVRQNKKTQGPILMETVGLDFDAQQVANGQFDALIRTVLEQLSEMDFDLENRVDLH